MELTLGCEVRDRFWAKVDKDGECWVWTASTNHHGYGRFRFEGEARLAHRVAYRMVIGEIPEGMEIDHLCRTRECVRPSHLEVVTRAENQHRGEGFGGVNYRKTHCPQGHEYTEENTYYFGRWRSCRECNRQSCRDRYAKRKGQKV